MASDLQEILDELKRKSAMQPRLKTETHDLAMEALEYAVEVSPEETGAFKDAWGVVDFPPRFEGDMPLSQLRNTDDGAVSIEYGTATTPPHAVMESVRLRMQLQASTKDIHI